MIPLSLRSRKMGRNVAMRYSLARREGYTLIKLVSLNIDTTGIWETTKLVFGCLWLYSLLVFLNDTLASFKYHEFTEFSQELYGRLLLIIIH